MTITTYKTMDYRPLRVIISGGGTGGHIFPAISIANQLKKLNPATEILFVGAEGKMEMEKVPLAGYEIIGLPIVGLQRQLTKENIKNDLKVPFKLLSSVRKAGKVIDGFKPDVAVGVGGYASAPLLWQATGKRIPALIQEQNGYAGLTNKLLGKRVQRVCVAYDGMERFFPKDRITLTGNPIRSEITRADAERRTVALEHYGLDPGRRHILIVGGSLGSGTLNKAVMGWVSAGCPAGEDVEVLWQCGKHYLKGVDEFMAKVTEDAAIGDNVQYVHHSEFLRRMDLAYAAADVVISRSGASTVSELCAAGKAAIFVPSPNVAEDHQTHNAMALVRKDAAMIITDAQAPEKLMQTAIALAHDPRRIAELEDNIHRLALPDAAQAICEEIYKLV